MQVWMHLSVLRCPGHLWCVLRLLLWLCQLLVPVPWARPGVLQPHLQDRQPPGQGGVLGEDHREYQRPLKRQERARAAAW